MKQIVRLLAILLIFCTLWSCQDSLGIDPEVVKKPVYPVIPAFEVDSLEFHFAELIGDDDEFFWESQAEISKSIVKLDTNGKTKIWIELEVRNKMPSNFDPWRSDRVLSFRMELDGVEIDSTESVVPLEGSPGGSAWCRTEVEFKQDGSQQVFGGDKTHGRAVFQHFRDQGLIQVLVVNEFITQQNVKTDAFFAAIMAVYK